MEFQQQQQLKTLIKDGLPLTPRPYATLGEKIGCHEQDILSQIQAWCANGMIKRFGLVVNHHQLGYHANAMVVWDIPDQQVNQIGTTLRHHPDVTLCYSRERALPHWQYNFYCMIHGKDRETVTTKITQLKKNYCLRAFPCEILFSTRQFKQCGGLYGPALMMKEVS